MPHVVARHGRTLTVIRLDFAEWVNQRTPGTYEILTKGGTVDEAFAEKHRLVAEERGQAAPAGTAPAAAAAAPQGQAELGLGGNDKPEGKE